MKSELTPRERVNLALAHRTPDRLPVDFLAVPEIWDLLAQRFDIASAPLDDSRFFDPAWEEILRRFEVDCRVISYDQFCAPPESAFPPAGRTEWWKVQSRSTPARMWRWAGEDGIATEIFGRRFKVQANELGSYEENIPALAAAESLADIKAHRWPDPDWWDFRPVKSVIREMNRTRAAPHPLPHGGGLRAGVAIARDGELPHRDGRRSRDPDLHDGADHRHHRGSDAPPAAARPATTSTWSTSTTMSAAI